LFALEVGQNLLNHQRIFDAGDDLDVVAAGLAGLDVDVEYALEALRLRLMAARRSAGEVSSGAFDAFALLPLPRLVGVTRARWALLEVNTAWNRIRLTLALRASAIRANRSHPWRSARGFTTDSHFTKSYRERFWENSRRRSRRGGLSLTHNSTQQNLSPFRHRAGPDWRRLFNLSEVSFSGLVP
jgi:hypothetical protein